MSDEVSPDAIEIDVYEPERDDNLTIPGLSFFQISVSGEKVEDLDVFSKSDPYCILKMKHFDTSSESKEDEEGEDDWYKAG